MIDADNLTNKLKKTYDTIIIGGGPAGLAAAIRCFELGIKDILIVERDSYPGGILPQCIHSGFGLKIFNREMTGPEYSQVFVDKLKTTCVEVMLNTMALSIKTEWFKKAGASGQKTDRQGLQPDLQRAQTDRQVSQSVMKDLQSAKPRSTADNTAGAIIEIIVTGKQTGFKVLYTKSVILALGCRERTRGQIMIPGARPAGVFTAGLVQRMVNIEGFLPGKEIVILGSGDIGLIMARRLTLEGCHVKGVYELMPFSTGLLRNISQCLDDYDIPLHLSHTVTNIIGGKRLEAVEVCRVDSNLKPVLASARIIKCDTLLLSVGLIPENELSKTCGVRIDKNTGGPAVDEDFQTSAPGIFSCGNSLFVYDLVDSVTEDAYKAAESAASYLTASKPGTENINAIDILSGDNAAYAVPQKVSGTKDVDFKIRAKVPLRNASVEINGTPLNKKYKYVNPGEMLFVTVGKQMLATGDVLSKAFSKDFAQDENGPRSITINIRGVKPA